MISSKLNALGLNLIILSAIVACNKSDTEIEENCIDLIDPSVEKTDDNTWYLESGGEKLIYFPIKAEALQVLEIIEEGGLQKHCHCGYGIYTDRYGNETFSDESRMMYYQLKSGNVGLDKASISGIGGQDCIDFDPETLKVSGKYLSYSGGTLFTFKSKKETKKALAIIEKYGFNQVCFIGNPGPSYVYLTRD